MYQISSNSQISNTASQVEVNPNFPEIPNPSVDSSSETLAIVMAMTIFGGVVKKLVA